VEFSFSDECVCGGSKKAPNPECERCRFVIALAEARKPKTFCVTLERLFIVEGDWMTVIGQFCREAGEQVYEHLLTQNPMDEEDAEWHTYSIPWEDGPELVNLIDAAAKAKLDWAIAFSGKNETVNVWAESKSLMSRDGASAVVRLK
jgi:hypothetical protein